MPGSIITHTRHSHQRTSLRTRGEGRASVTGRPVGGGEGRVVGWSRTGGITHLSVSEERSEASRHLLSHEADLRVA